MKNSVAKNYIYNTVYELLKIIVPLITTPYLARVLGPENIGIYSYTVSITTYFVLMGSLGVSMYGQREIAYVQNNKYERSKTFLEIIIMRFITLGISLFLFYIIFVTNNEYSVYYKILTLEIIASSLDISWFFQGLEEFKKTVLRNTLVKVISVICIFAFVKTIDNLKEYLLIYVLSNLFGNISLWLYLPKYISKIDIRKLHLMKHLKSTIALFIPQIAIQIYTVLDKTMLGAMILDKAEVGFYEQAQKIVKLLMVISTSIITVMLPRMAYTFATGDKRKLKEYMYKSFSVVLLLVFPITFGIISVSDKFVPVFYGAGYEKVQYLIKIISPIIAFISLSELIGLQYLLPTKRQKEFTISVTVGAIVNIILNLIFIRLWKSVGASISTIISELVVTIIDFYFIRKEIKFINVLKISKNYFFASIIMFIASLTIGLFISNNILSIVIQVLCSSILYFTLLICMKDKFVYSIINVLKQKISKKTIQE